jgi:hypothetical protein
LPDLKTLLSTLRGELDPASVTGRPAGAGGPKIPPPPGMLGTVPLPGQGAHLKPQITMKRKEA